MSTTATPIRRLATCLRPLAFAPVLLFACHAALASSPIRPDRTGRVAGVVEGLNGTSAIVTVGNDRYLRSIRTDAAGNYAFTQVPDGKYFVKVEANGRVVEKAKEVTVKGAAVSWTGGRFKAQALNPNKFVYQWTADASRSGYEVSASINVPPTVQFLNEAVVPADPSAAPSLREDYSIILSSEQVAWTQEYASRFLGMMKIIPQLNNGALPAPRKASKWILTDQLIADDIRIEQGDGGDTITLSTAAMVNASPRMVLLDGVKGKFFSKRLHHALLRYVTNYGNDVFAVEKILHDRFGVSIMVPDYGVLTASTTHEDANHFNQFRPGELLDIVSMFEEMPSGLHVVNGLKYLVRRAFAQGIPDCPCAAVARTAAGYIEFEDGAFVDLSFAYHTILHEKGHFLWDYLFDSKLKDAWASVGGWSRSADDRDGWITSKTTEFVTPYAHKKNPNEDMAESLAAYILNPELLKSRSPGKLTFIRENVMQGNSYVSSIREDLKFDVYNLFPDYDYPGKLKRVSVVVDGAPASDKRVTVELEVEHVEGRQDDAEMAYLRMYSSGLTCKELWLYRKPGEPNILTGSFELSKHAKNGYWAVDQVRVIDTVGNERYEGVEDFGWKMYVDNPLEDLVPPTYVPNSLTISPMAPVVIEGHTVQKLLVTYKVDDNYPINNTELTLDRCCDLSVELLEKNSKMVTAMFGRYDSATKTLSAEFELTEFYATGDYGVAAIYFKDAAGNGGHQYFTDSPKDEPFTSVYVSTANPDYQGPDIDLNKIAITATPTNPRAPNGETLVHIDFLAKDDKSGIRSVRYFLTDPQGITHQYYFSDKTWQTRFFVGDANVWRNYSMDDVLPVGSAPGKWGLARIEILDQANNTRTYDFSEIMQFEIIR